PGWGTLRCPIGQIAVFLWLRLRVLWLKVIAKPVLLPQYGEAQYGKPVRLPRPKRRSGAGQATQEVCRVRARRRAGRAGRRAGARVLVLSLVATVPGTGHPIALAGTFQPQVDPGVAPDAPLQVPQPGGLTGPDWNPEPPSVQVKELATLSGLHASARLPFAKAAAVLAHGPHQDALARRLLHA